jgi:hypothetical protein
MLMATESNGPPGAARSRKGGKPCRLRGAGSPRGRGGGPFRTAIVTHAATRARGRGPHDCGYALPRRFPPARRPTSRNQSATAGLRPHRPATA